MRLLITGGGTGGHVYPMLAVVASLAADARTRNRPLELLYVGGAGNIEERLAARAGLPFQSIAVGGIRGQTPLAAARNLVRLVASINRARGIMRAFHADVILATGGFVSAPVIWAASFEKTPVVIYLPDLEPGWAIRILAQWAKKVAVSFPEVTAYFPRERVVVTGYPVRAEFYQADSTPAREHFQLNPRERVVTIFGGSRGAHSINLAVAENLRALVDLAQILHITGPADERAFQDQRAALPDPARYRVFGYLDDEMHLALAAADVVVARAGAATVGEFPAAGVPSILVPYPYAGLHQDKNAEYLVSRGASVRIADAALGRELVPTLAGLLNDDARREKMRAAAKALAVPDAAERIGALLVEAAG